MAETDSTLEVVRAVVAALKADAGVSNDVGARVYWQAPQSVTFPYVQIASIVGSRAVVTHDGEGFDLGVSLHVHARGPAAGAEASRIAANIVDVLNNSTLALDSKTVVMCVLLDQIIRPISDPEAQVIQRWQFVTDG